MSKKQKVIIDIDMGSEADDGSVEEPDMKNKPSNVKSTPALVEVTVQDPVTEEEKVRTEKVSTLWEWLKGKSYGEIWSVDSYSDLKL